MYLYSSILSSIIFFIIIFEKIIVKKIHGLSDQMNIKTVGMLLIVISICILLLYLMFRRHHYKVASPLVAVEALPQAASYTMKKILLAQWKWKYYWNGDSNVTVTQICPTMHADSALFVKGAMVARTSGVLLSVSSTVYIQRPDGFTLYTLKTGNFFATFINHIQTTFRGFEILDATGTRIGLSNINYHGVNDNFSLVDPITGDTIVTCSRQKITLTVWTWNIHVLSTQMDHPLNDPVLLALLVGKVSFGSDDGATDLCNTFFVLGVIVLVIILLLCCALFINDNMSIHVNE